MAVKWEYKLGPITANFRVLLEPKGFLRIIMVVIAILAFSITAGFTDGTNDNSLSCTSNITNASQTLEIEFRYPFRRNNFEASYSPNSPLLRNRTACSNGFDNKAFAGFAQFFVAMGVLSFLYCLGAIFVYIFFQTPELPFAKWIIVADFIISIIFALLYFLADIMWSAGIAQMSNYVEEELERRGRGCLQCIDGVDADAGTYGQPAISVVFGWLLCFVWFASLWFVYKDTFWHKDLTGPLTSVYSPKTTTMAGTGGETVTGTGQGGSQPPQSAPPPEPKESTEEP